MSGSNDLAAAARRTAIRRCVAALERSAAVLDADRSRRDRSTVRVLVCVERGARRALAHLGRARR